MITGCTVCKFFVAIITDLTQKGAGRESEAYHEPQVCAIQPELPRGNTRGRGGGEMELWQGKRRLKGLGHEVRIRFKWFGLIRLGFGRYS
jgi:hypothetical protein